MPTMKGDEMKSVISEAKQLRLATIPKLTDEEVRCIWDSVSEYIGRNMAIQKGVAIPKFGIFTFSQQKLDIGSNKVIMIQRPIFVLSEKFAKIHALHTVKTYTDGVVPIIPLNFAAISQDIDFDRDTVEQCIKDMILALSRSLQAKKNVECIFPTIGKLIIRHSKVKMKFYKDFMQTIDATGDVSNAMMNRPETSDSVISRSVTPMRYHSPTTNNAYLPRINPGESLKENKGTCIAEDFPRLKTNPSMPMIREEIEVQDCDAPKHGSAVQGCGQGEFMSSSKIAEDQNGNAIKGPKSPARLKTAPENEEFTSQAEVKFAAMNSAQEKVQPSSSDLKPTSSVIDKLEKSSKSLGPLKNYRGMDVANNACSNCFHDAGQELCYLCYQRDRRNIPIYLHEERKRKELEDDRLLQQYQHIKDYEAILKDQDHKAASREHAQKVAAFNLGVAEAINTKKHEKAQDFHRSFVFYKRSVSPSASLSQQKYHLDLAKQVKQREKYSQKAKKEKDVAERIEQVQLAEELIAQREQYLKNKRLQSEEYKRALDTQLRYKPLPLSGAYPDSEHPYLGKHEMDHNKMLEKRQENRRLFEDQLSAAAEKKRNAILSDLKTQKEETLMLTRAKTDLLEESIKRNKVRVNLRRDLEDTWLQAAKYKLARESEEKQRAQSPGTLLHDQCSKYKKCASCKRKLMNCGESNIWCESRYLSGSRIIV